MAASHWKARKGSSSSSSSRGGAGKGRTSRKMQRGAWAEPAPRGQAKQASHALVSEAAVLGWLRSQERGKKTDRDSGGKLQRKKRERERPG